MKKKIPTKKPRLSHMTKHLQIIKQNYQRFDF